MYGTGNKRVKRICKWIASLLMIALLINESGISALSAEIREMDSCICDEHCNADSVNKACSVCRESHGKCNAAKAEKVSAPDETPEQQENDALEMPEQQEGDMPKTPVSDCICGEHCNADNINEDCPVCCLL